MVPAPQDATRVIARNMRMLRKAHGLTAAQLGAELHQHGVGWDRFTVANLESGKRQNVTVQELLALSSVLAVDLKMLLDERLAITATIRPESA